jgi:hypothetical protein
MMKFDEEPVFNSECLVENVPNISFPTPMGMRTILYMLNEEGLPCRRQYLNGKKFDDISFLDFESLEMLINGEMDLFDEFKEFMKQHETVVAKRIRITKKYEEIQ